MTTTTRQGTYKNREMAVAPFPVAVAKQPVMMESGPRNSWITGHVYVIYLSDNSTVPCCSTSHGHKSADKLRACATAKVAELNDAAGIPEAVR